MSEPAKGGKYSVAASVTIVLLASVITFLLFEGGYALARWDHAEGSLTYNLYVALRDRLAKHRLMRDQPLLPLASRADFDALLPVMKAAAVGIGNSPYTELESESTAINQRDAQGCLTQKPNLDTMVTALRSVGFEPFDPPTLFVDANRVLPPALQDFVRRYAVRQLHHRTNAYGERLTVPTLERHDKVLLAGDSVANGLMVNDEETLASQLQARDAQRQYINLGIGGADAPDIFCALDAAARRYAGTIAELIYVYCENDMQPGTPLGTPQEVMAALEAFVRRENIAKVTVVYAPYIFNVMPALTRFKGYRGYRRPYHTAERATLMKSTQDAGFRFIDIGALGREENARLGSEFAAFALYVDHVHLSPRGAAMLADRLRAQ
jgi:hypothetical protein